MINRKLVETKFGLTPNDVISMISTSDAFIYKGVIDCSSNPNYPAADNGHIYKISVAGLIGGSSGMTVEIGDMIICHTDSAVAGDHVSVGSSWDIIQGNIDFSSKEFLKYSFLL